jgi:hypothetical protein
VSEQLWPDRIREISQSRIEALSQRWQALSAALRHESLRDFASRAASRLSVITRMAPRWLPAGIALPHLNLRGAPAVFAAYCRRRRAGPWAAAFTLLLAIVIAFPLLLGPSADAVHSVNRAARAIVATAGGDQPTESGAAADRGLEALGKGPAGSPSPENGSSGSLPFVGGDVSTEESDNSELVSTYSDGDSPGSADTDRATPTRRNEPESGGVSTGRRIPPESSPQPLAPSPQPQGPQSPPANPISAPPPPNSPQMSPPPPPPPPAPLASSTSTSSTTTTTTRIRRQPPPPPTSTTTTTTTTTKKNPPPPPTTSTTSTSTTTTTTTRRTPPPAPPPPTTTTGGGHDDDDD